MEPVNIFITSHVCQDETFISVYGIVQDADWIAYIKKGAVVTPKMIRDFSESELADEKENYQYAQEMLERFRNHSKNDRALVARPSLGLFISVMGFSQTAREKNWVVQEEFDGFVH